MSDSGSTWARTRSRSSSGTGADAVPPPPRHGDTGEGVVAGAARGLDEGRERATREPAEAHRLDELVVGERRLEGALEEVGGGDLPATVRPDRLDDAAGEDGDGGHLPGRVGMGDRADRRAAVADRRVCDVADCLAEQGKGDIRARVPLETRVPDQGADPYPPVVDLDAR